MVKIEVKEGRKHWVILVNGDEVFGRVGRDTNYREHGMEAGGPGMVVLDADRGIFNRMLKSALDKLWLRIGRMGRGLADGFLHSEGTTVIRLAAEAGWEDQMLGALGGFVDDFLDASVLCDWYARAGLADETGRCSYDAEVAMKNILTVVHYRNRPVRRPVDPVF